MTVFPKPTEIFDIRPPNFVHAYQKRSGDYQKLLTDTMAEFGLPDGLIIAANLGDEAEDVKDAPVSSFQISIGGLNPLLPDFELVGYEYLQSAPHDQTAYAQKKTRAVFSGSTTGGGVVVMLPQVINHSAFPRLRAARYFRHRTEVDFRLPAIVQCDAQAEAYLREEGFGVGLMDWREALENKFILSLDGNGATCSRPAIILISGSVLVRYESDSVLFWTSALVPWVHYIPVLEDASVIRIVHREQSEPGRYEHIAKEGTVFAKRSLSRRTILRYTAALLQTYDTLLGE